MTPDELREAITRNQTRCRCGHLLAACADCRDLYAVNLGRYERSWALWNDCGFELQATWGVDAAEAECLAWFNSCR